MVNSRKFVPQTSTSVESRIRSRWYPANPPTLNKRPRQIGVVVRQPNPGSPKDRYVFAEGHLGHARLQPYVHDCKATVREGPHIYKYRVFFKRHCRLPLSVCLTTLLGNQGPPVLRSDVVVVRLGEEDAPVNMRDRDSIVADWLVKEFATLPVFYPNQTLPFDLDYIKADP